MTNVLNETKLAIFAQIAQKLKTKKRGRIKL